MGGQQSEPVVWVSASLTDKKNPPTLQNNLMLGSLIGGYKLMGENKIK